MALLLAMFQKMRLVREINQESLKLMRFSSKVDRIAKTITNVQKMYEGRKKSLEQMAQRFQNNASIFFQNQFRIGSNSTSPFNYSGMSEFVYNAIGSLMSQDNENIKWKDADGNVTTFAGMKPEKIQEMLDEYMTNGRFISKTDTNGNVLPNEYKKWSPEQVMAFNQAMRTGQMQQSMAQTQCQQVTQQYQNNISIWLDAQMAQLEAEQDAALDPLEYEQTMMELDKTASEDRLARLKAEKESYDQLVSEEAKNAAPKFGL